MRAVFLAAAVGALIAPAASAQYTAAKQAAKNAAAATNQHIANEQRTDAAPESQQRPRASAPAAQQQMRQTAPAPQQQARPASSSRVATTNGTRRPQDALNIAHADTVSAPVEIMREVYHYARDARRDPFVSLLSPGSDLRPTLSDLKLTTIIYDPAGRHSLAVLRDLATNEQHRVGPGANLGRMIVAHISPKSIVFTIDEFGTNRQDSLVLTDPTKVRP
jgi:hypothetical protein